MNSTNAFCDRRVDNTFGPQVQGCRDDFDFTLLFEQSILTIAPSTLLLLLFPLRASQLYRQSVKTWLGYLCWAKMGAAAVFAGLQLALLVLWSQQSAPHTRASLAAASLALVDALVIGVLSYAEHTRSVRPSTVLSVYLFMSALFDIAQTRTLWLLPGTHPLAATFTASLALKVVILVLETAEKRSLLAPAYQSSALETTSGFFNRGVFWWLNSLFVSGYRGLLSTEDLFRIDDHLGSKLLQDRLQQEWQASKKTGSHPLAVTLFSTFRWALLSAVVPRLCLIGFNFSQPFLINRTIDLVSQPETESSRNDGYGLIGATVLIYVGIALSKCFYQHTVYRFITMLRGSLVALIFNKTTEIALDALDDSAAITLMSTDIDNLASGLQNMHEIWANAIEIGIGIYLLEKQVGVACIFVVIMAVACFFLTERVADLIGPRMGKWNQAIQKRVSVTSSVINQIKSVKLTGLTGRLSADIQALRVAELELSKGFRRIIALLVFTANFSDAATPFIIIVAAALWTKSSGSLTVAEAFTALSIISLVVKPLTDIITSLPSFKSSIACSDRIQKYLLATDRMDHRLFMSKTERSQTTDDGEASSSPNLDIELQRIRPKPLSATDRPLSDDILTVEDGSFGPIGGGASGDAPLLHDINIRFPRGSITMIIGPVGAGKSTLLKALLGEVPSSKGFVRVASPGAAYCDQTPWLVNRTIRENVLGPASFDEAWYATVMDACALERDLVQLPDGDQSVVGSGGVTLSGGQKQRLALARAVYSRKPLVVLDDIFSGLDKTTERQVFARLFDHSGLFRQIGSTVVLATHAVHHIPTADRIVVLREGTVVEQGGFGELQAREGYVRSLEVKELASPNSAGAVDSAPEYIVPPPSPDAIKTKNNAQDLTRKTGDFEVYKYYFKSVGWRYFLPFVALGAIYIFLGHIPEIWVRVWTEAGTDHDRGLYVGVYTAVVVARIMFSVIAIGFFFVIVLPKSAEYLHWELLKTIMRAPFSYFSTTDNGEILNRFSQDMSLVDQALPGAAFSTTLDILEVVSETALICSGASYVAAIVPFSAAVVYGIQKYYLRTSRQLRFLDLESKSPLYTHFSETLSGLATLRAFGWQPAFQSQNLAHLDASQRPYYLLYCIQRWLNVVLDLFVAGIALVLVTLAVQLRHTTSSGAVGLALVNIIGFNTSLSRLIESWTKLETSLGAIARLRTLAEAVKPEDGAEGALPAPPSGWPASGRVELEGVSAAYGGGAGAPNVLRDVSAVVEPGWRVGVCGRTGSGKTSLMLALFRLLELTAGRVAIDGVDLATLPREAVRAALTAVPQEPVTLPGSLRYNLDPSRTLPDSAIVGALEKVRLWELVRERGGLDVDAEAVPLSAGQKQLLCLAAALLRKSRVVVLDEATSSVDKETEAVMQRILKEEFAGCTVITIAHRLETIIDSDRIAVLDRGRLVEFDAPETLLERESAFKVLYNSH